MSGLKTTNNSASVIINGKVIATKDIDIYSGKIDIPGKMLAGTGNNTVINGKQRAEEIFNSIVNTTNMHAANNMSSNNGYITLTSGVGTSISGNMQNVGYGNTRINNTGYDGVRISGNTINHNGNTIIQNEAGGVHISGNLSNYNGRLTINNNGGNGINITKSGTVNAINPDNPALSFSNTGNDGINIDGTVNSRGEAVMYNKAGGSNGLNINGTLNNEGYTYLINDGSKGLNINGKINNTTDVLDIVNNGDNGFNLNNTGVINSEGLKIYNTGNNGLNVYGTITDKGEALLTNSQTGNGGLNIAGNYTNYGDSVFENNGEGGLNISGTVTNKDGQLDINNYGYNGLNINKTGLIDSQGLNTYNTGERDLISTAK